MYTWAGIFLHYLNLKSVLYDVDFSKEQGKDFQKAELTIVSEQFLKIFNAAISKKMRRTKHS